MLRLAVLIALSLTVSSVRANAKIYTYLDAQGQRHYTDVPDNNRYRLLVLSPQDRTEPTIERSRIRRFAQFFADHACGFFPILERLVCLQEKRSCFA